MINITDDIQMQSYDSGVSQNTSLIQTPLTMDDIPELKNVIIWHDGTIRPMNHHNQCTGKWDYDGQVFTHKDCK